MCNNFVQVEIVPYLQLAAAQGNAASIGVCNCISVSCGQQEAQRLQIAAVFAALASPVLFLQQREHPRARRLACA
jgi:hypothetical protein